MTSKALSAMLADAEVVVVTGPGGVGKTSIAAALGGAAVTAADAGAVEGRRVLVLTVDPARRLATALGLESFGNVERQVDHELFRQAGVAAPGELWIAMLDTKASWDELIARHAPDEATRESILDNALYRNITGRFVQSHDYIAMERLYEIEASGRYDLIIVDTPPTRSALDVLDAPERMADFFSSRLLRWLIAPARSRLVSAASKPFSAIADRLLGATFLADIAEFFLLFQTLYDGFVERADAVAATLASDTTTFVVVTTPEYGPAREATFLLDALAERDLRVGAVVANRVLPNHFTARGAATAARSLRKEAAHLAAGSPVKEGVLRELADRFADYRKLANHGSETLDESPLGTTPIQEVPYLEEEVADLAGVLGITSALVAR